MIQILPCYQARRNTSSSKQSNARTLTIDRKIFIRTFKLTRRWATCRRNHDQTIVTEQAERAVVITLRQPACSQQQPKAVPFSSCIAALARIVASRLMVEQMQTCRGALADHLPRLSTAIEFAHVAKLRSSSLITSADTHTGSDGGGSPARSCSAAWWNVVGVHLPCLQWSHRLTSWWKSARSYCRKKRYAVITCARGCSGCGKPQEATA